MDSVAEEPLIIFSKESAKSSGSVSLPVGRTGVDISNKLASWALKMSISSSKKDIAEGPLVEGSARKIGAGKGEEDALASSIVLAASRCKEVWLELRNRGSSGMLPVPFLEVLAATEVGWQQKYS